MTIRMLLAVMKYIRTY